LQYYFDLLFLIRPFFHPIKNVSVGMYSHVEKQCRHVLTCGKHFKDTLFH